MHRLVAALLVLLLSPTLAALQVEDDTGRSVRLAAPASRIVSLAPHATELLYAIDAGARLVAASAYSDFPPAARLLPRVGSLGGLDRERLLTLQPDLVVAWASGNKSGDLQWLQSRECPLHGRYDTSGQLRPECAGRRPAPPADDNGYQLAES